MRKLEGGERDAAGDGHHLTIITTDPNEVMESPHHRMSVIIESKDYNRWLQLAEAEARPLDLLRPIPFEKMRACQTRPLVGNVRNGEEWLLVCDDAATLWRRLLLFYCHQKV